MRRLICIGLLSLIGLAGSSHAAPRKLILKVLEAPLAWGQSDLEDQLVTKLSRDQNFRVITPSGANQNQPPFPGDYRNIDSLIDWGTEVGGRYLMVVDVKREALERRKGFGIPLLYHRWKTVGVIEGELRLLDLQKRRLLVAEPFSVEQTGATQFQGDTDNNRNTPSLHIPASEKSRFFQELEMKLAQKLTKDMVRFMRRR
jgi:hypothetical protein